MLGGVIIYLIKGIELIVACHSAYKVESPGPYQFKLFSRHLFLLRPLYYQLVLFTRCL